MNVQCALKRRTCDLRSWRVALRLAFTIYAREESKKKEKNLRYKS